MTKHLSDSDIQKFALHSNECDADILEHIQICEHCKSQVHAYGLIFSEIEEQSKPKFDFDLSELVLAKIEQPKQQFDWNNLLIPSIAIALVGLFFYLSKKYLLTLLSDVSTMSIYLIAASMVTILILQGLEIYNKYNKQMNQLRFS